MRAQWRAEPRDHRLALLVIVLTGVVLRALTLSQPIRYDEAVTYLEFVRQPLSQALSRYDYPNNHLFHTLLAKGSVELLGNHLWALRLPAFLAGLGIIPCSYLMTRQLYGARPALVAAALVSSSGVLALYATNARGYSIVVLAFLLLVIIAAQLIRAPSAPRWVAFAVIAALGVWTIPVMLYPLGAVSLWLALSFVTEGRRRELFWLAATLGAGAGLTLLAYGPVFSHAGLAAVASNKFVAATVWTQFLSDLAVAGWDTLKSWGLGLPPITVSVILSFAVVALGRHGRVSAFRVGLPLAAYVWSAWLLVVTHRAPFPRIWLWCVPGLAALAGAGLVDVLSHRTRLAPVASRVPLLSVLIAVTASASVALSGAVLQTRDTGTFVDAQATAEQLAGTLRRGDRVVAAIPTNGPLAYWFDRLHLDPASLRLDEAAARRLIVVVNEGEGESVDDVLESPAARDTANFSMTLLADRPLSKVYVFERRHASR